MTVPPDDTARSCTLLQRLRANLDWLRDDGYEETLARVLRSRFQLGFAGPNGRIDIVVNPGMSEIETWLTPKDEGGLGPAMQEYLMARGLPAPPQRIDATTPDAVEAAIDEHAAALKLLRDKELAGDWTRLDRAEHVAAARRRREEIVDEMVRRAGDKPDEG